LILLSWLIMIAWLAMSFVITKDKDVLVSEVAVNIHDREEASFVTETDIEKMILKEIPRLKNTNIYDINSQDLEDVIRKHPSLSRADVYKTEGGFLRVDVRQKKPILRLVAKGGNAYIEENGTLMYFSISYTAHVPVATGNFYLPADFTDTSSYSQIIRDLYQLTLFLQDDPLWSAQFEQIYIDKNKEIILIPRIGNHRVRISTIDDLEMKFKKLRALYEQVFMEYGWKKYKEINLKYKGQVVCTTN
jgi:cell division protein FtsQ